MFAPAPRSSEARASIRSAVVEVIATTAPRRASSRAAAKPIPLSLPQPVTRAVRAVKSNGLSAPIAMSLIGSTFESALESHPCERELPRRQWNGSSDRRQHCLRVRAGGPARSQRRDRGGAQAAAAAVPRTLGGRPRKHRGTRGGRRPDRAEEATGQAIAGYTSQPVPHRRCKMGLRSRHSWTEYREGCAQKWGEDE